MSATKFHELPILDVHKENIEEVWPLIIKAINQSTFVGLDAELSGLGAKSGLNSSDIEDRYRAMIGSAQTRSLLSIGLSCFKLTSVQNNNHSPEISETGQNNCHDNATSSPPQQQQPSTNGETTRNAAATTASPPFSVQRQSSGSGSVSSSIMQFETQTFNIFTLCQDDFMVEPDSLMFLVGHGFDFNLQFEKGLPYYRGADHEKNQMLGEKSVRNLFCSIVASKKPLILHNGILDLVFLYGNLYAPLPPTMSTFVADLAEMFSGGIYDTKTFAEYKLRLDASYLTYVFRKLQRQNHDKEMKGKTHVRLDFVGEFLLGEKLSKDLLYRDCSIRDPPAFQVTTERPVCENFASHGWCTSAHSCPFSHDIDDILDMESNRGFTGGNRRAKKTKRRLKSIAFDSRPAREEDELTAITDDAIITLTSKDDSHLDTSSSETSSATGCNGPSMRGNKRTESTCSEAIIHNTHGHRAGYDAFMTAFTLACLMSHQPPQHLQQMAQQLEQQRANDCFLGLNDFRNKLFLSRKDFQLAIIKSPFGKVSREHQKKMEKLKLASYA